jgi:hypothetical protein
VGRIGGIWAVLLCLVAGGVGLAATARGADRIYLVTYEGSYTYKAHQTGLGNADFTDSLTWTMRAYYDSARGTVTRSLVAQGAHIAVDTGAFANNSYNCTLHQSGRTADLPLTVGPGDKADTLALTAGIPADAAPGGALTSTGTGHCQLTSVLGATASDGSMQTGGCAVFRAAPAFALEQAVRSAPEEGFTRKIDLDQTAKQTGGCENGSTFTATRSIHAKLVVGQGGVPAPPRPPQEERQKVFAVSDLLTTLLRAQGPCGLVAIGSGAVVFGSTIGPTGSAAFVPATLLFSAGGPMCAIYAVQAYRDILIANDPPLGDINVIAVPGNTPTGAADAKLLPPCSKEPAKWRALCSALRADLGAEIAAAQRDAAIDGALLMTVDRETAAQKSHQTAALARQLAAGDRLVSELAGARRELRVIGARIAGEIGARHVSGRLTAAQDAKAIAALLRRLRAHGVSRAALERLAPAALKPGPYDLLAHLH